MKKFKTADMWVSIGLITGFAVVSLVKQDSTFMTGYFVVGGWQVISMIVHATTQTFIRPVGTRYVYHWIAFISVITMPIGSVWILLFAAPVMAVFYTALCYSEVRKMNQRPLDVLK
jgi:hypothetical protein